jgi:hypothetical protein
MPYPAGRGRLMEPPEGMSWLNAALGLDRYRISHRLTPNEAVFRREGGTLSELGRSNVSEARLVEKGSTDEPRRHFLLHS